MPARSAPRGVLHVHACPPALCPHVEWAVAARLGSRVSMSWTPQPVAPGSLRAECSWRASVGTAERLVTALRGWPVLRFEATEEPSPGHDGQRFSVSPALGLFHAVTSANGDVMVGEDRMRALLTGARGREELAHGLDRLLGTAWDADLEPYRQGGDGAPVTWLHRVG